MGQVVTGFCLSNYIGVGVKSSVKNFILCLTVILYVGFQQLVQKTVSNKSNL